MRTDRRTPACKAPIFVPNNFRRVRPFPSSTCCPHSVQPACPNAKAGWMKQPVSANRAHPPIAPIGSPTRREPSCSAAAPSKISCAESPSFQNCKTNPIPAWKPKKPKRLPIPRTNPIQPLSAAPAGPPPPSASLPKLQKRTHFPHGSPGNRSAYRFQERTQLKPTFSRPGGATNRPPLRSQNCKTNAVPGRNPKKPKRLPISRTKPIQPTFSRPGGPPLPSAARPKNCKTNPFPARKPNKPKPLLIPETNPTQAHLQPPRRAAAAPASPPFCTHSPTSRIHWMCNLD